jgi:hypothetical protein
MTAATVVTPENLDWVTFSDEADPDDACESVHPKCAKEPTHIIFFIRECKCFPLEMRMCFFHAMICQELRGRRMMCISCRKFVQVVKVQSLR